MKIEHGKRHSMLTLTKNWSGYINTHKADSKAYNITGNKEGNLIMIKNNPKCLCIYSRALKYKRKTVVTANRQTHKYSQRFQSPLSITDRTSRQKSSRTQTPEYHYQPTGPNQHL